MKLPAQISLITRISYIREIREIRAGSSQKKLLVYSYDYSLRFSLKSSTFEQNNIN